MRAARREGQRDAPLCPVGCKRNLLSGYAVPAVLTVADNNAACHTAIFDISLFLFFWHIGRSCQNFLFVSIEIRVIERAYVPRDTWLNREERKAPRAN